MPIVVIEFGIKIYESEEHPWNVWSLIVVIENGRKISFNDLHSLNADSSIFVTDDWIDISVKWKHLFKSQD